MEWINFVQALGGLEQRRIKKQFSLHPMHLLADRLVIQLENAIELLLKETYFPPLYRI